MPRFEALGTRPGDPILLRRDLVADGWTDEQIARAVRGGFLYRVRWGAYCVLDGEDAPGPEAAHRMRARAVLRTASSAVVLSHVSSLLEQGVECWDVPLDDIHTTRLDGRAGRRQAGVAQHRGRLNVDEVVERDGLRVTTPARTGIDVSRVVDTERAVVVLDGLLRHRLVTLEDLWTAYAATEGWPDSGATRVALLLAEVGSGSVGESRLRYLCWKYRLPKPELQYEVRDCDGSIVGVVDLAWPEWGVLCEFDGRDKYTRYLRPGEQPGDAVFREKVREDRIREITGFTFLRFTWADLHRPQRTAHRIREALGHRARSKSS